MNSRAVEYDMDIDTDNELWSAIPDLEGYEVSNMARVRSFRTKGMGDDQRVEPLVLKAMDWKGERVYSINGGKMRLDDIMRSAFGLEDEWGEEIAYSIEGRERTLSQYERNEITMSEGYKPAHEVAAEFRIESSRVRAVWDGAE
jgi:hypothetical protein